MRRFREGAFCSFKDLKIIPDGMGPVGAWVSVDDGLNVTQRLPARIIVVKIQEAKMAWRIDLGQHDFQHEGLMPLIELWCAAKHRVDCQCGGQCWHPANHAAKRAGNG